MAVLGMGGPAGAGHAAPPGGAGREGGFTVVELALAMALFSILVYVSMSLVSTAAGTMARVFAEYDSRKRVLVLQREMAEGTRHYAGYLAASHVSFGPGTGELAGACVFRFQFPDYEDASQEREVLYVWWPGREVIEQRVDGGGPRVLLENVARFTVTKAPGDAYTLRVEIAHRVKGFSQPITRVTEGQARNMALRSNALAEALKECGAP